MLDPAANAGDAISMTEADIDKVDKADKADMVRQRRKTERIMWKLQS
jgi:hypothetical protein